MTFVQSLNLISLLPETHPGTPKYRCKWCFRRLLPDYEMARNRALKSSRLPLRDGTHPSVALMNQNESVEPRMSEQEMGTPNQRIENMNSAPFRTQIPGWHQLLGSFLAMFGLMTIAEGGSVLFGSEEARLAAGNYVPFVLWFNFLAGFFYILGGIGVFLRKTWAKLLALCLASGSAVVFAAFGVYIMIGGLFEKRTVFAMTLRTVVWAATAAYIQKNTRTNRLLR